jgi:SAM-dependent methyltransferase
MATRVCPICSNTKITIEDKKTGVFFCEPCNHRFRLNAQDFVKKHYDNYIEESKEKLTNEHRNFFVFPNWKLYDYIISKIPYKKDSKLLEVACGTGTCLRHIQINRADLKLYGIDLFQNSRGGINFIKGDIYNTEIKEKFDVIVCKEIIEHTEDIKKFMRKLKPLLKKDGILFINITDSNVLIYRLTKLIKSIWSVPYERLHRPYHLNYFTEQSFRNLLNLSGFKTMKTKRYSAPLISIDTPHKSFVIRKIYKILAMLLFFISRLLRQEYYLMFICKNNMK